MAATDPSAVDQITSILRYVWVIMIPIFLWFYNRLEKLKDNTYTKQETQDQIKLLTQPLFAEQRHISDKLSNLEILIKESIAKSDKRDEAHQRLLLKLAREGVINVDD